MKPTLLVLFMCGLMTAYTQKKIKPLTVGDRVPDLVFNNCLNYKTAKARLSDFKGKLVILDMWATTCSSCIAAFPQMSALQKEFDGKIQILLVNPHKTKFETIERIKSAVDKYKSRTGDALTLPIPIYDTVLNYYFPHQSIPHEIWIDKSGVVMGITNGWDVTNENVAAVLAGEKIRLPLKNDFGFDSNIPLLVNGNGGGDDGFIFRSVFTKYNSGLETMVGSRRNGNDIENGFYAFNLGLRDLLVLAYGKELNSIVSYNRWMYDLQNLQQFENDKDTSNRYCYDVAFIPLPEKIYNVRAFLRSDLAKVFNISVSLEKRKISSYIITADKDVANAYTKYSSSKSASDLDESSIKKYLHNFSLDEAAKTLEWRVDKPLINDTGISNHIDIDFPDHFNIADKKGIIEFLKKAGFTIKEEERELEVVVITDK